jgi:hypothetical protein
VPVLRTPDHMVCCLIDAIPVSYNLNHGGQFYTTWYALRTRNSSRD